MDTQENFTPGTAVVYGLHGKCQVVAIEPRRVGDQMIEFYKLEPQKSALSRSNRPEPAIWLPVLSARAKGLRNPINVEQANATFAVLESREYYFSLNEAWNVVTAQLENTIRNEGAIGLAKTYSYLQVLKRKQIVPTPEVNRMSETVAKLLFRELSDVLGESMRALEERANKAMRQKLLPDN